MNPQSIALNAILAMMRPREGAMLDRSQTRAGTQADPRRPQQPAAGDPAQRAADARAQQALRRALAS